MSRLTSALISKGATNAKTYSPQQRLDPGRVSGTLSGVSRLSSPGTLSSPRIQPGLISAAQVPDVPMIDQSPIQDALNRGGQAFMLAMYKGAMDMADKRSAAEAQQGMLNLRTAYRKKFYDPKGGLVHQTGEAGSRIYKDNEQSFFEIRDQIAEGLDPAARRKFLVASEPYLNGKLNELAKMEVANLKQWEADRKVQQEQIDVESIVDGGKWKDIDHVWQTIVDGSSTFTRPAEKQAYVNRMWTNWANYMTMQPGEENVKSALFRAAKQLPPEMGGMDVPTQNAIQRSFNTIDEAAAVTDSYNALTTQHGGIEGALQALADPDTVKEMGIKTATALRQILSAQVTIKTKMEAQARAEQALQVEQKLNELINSGEPIEAQTFINSLPDSFDKMGMLDKVAKAQDRTDPMVYQHAAKLAAEEKWSELSQYVAEKRLNGLNNTHSDRYEKMIADSHDTGGSKESPKKMVMQMAKDRIEGPLLPGFEMMLDEYIATHDLKPTDPAILDVGKKLLEPYRESRIPLNDTYVPIEDELKFGRTLAKKGGAGTIKRQKYLSDKVKTRYELIQEGVESMPEPETGEESGVNTELLNSRLRFTE